MAILALKGKEKAAYITPVPGGVGPMTIATLIENTLYSAVNLHLNIQTLNKDSLMSDILFKPVLETLLFALMKKKRHYPLLILFNMWKTVFIMALFFTVLLMTL